MATDRNDWNFAAVWETVAQCIPDHPAVIQGPRRVLWRDFSRRADALAQLLLEHGLVHQDKVAHYLYNCPEYLETTFAAFKAALVPVNTNYRYRSEELAYLWDDCDAAAVVFHSSLAAQVAEVRSRLTRVRVWICVEESGFPCPDWAIDYEAAVKRDSSGGTRSAQGLSGDDLILLYTGGTTGMPKGVMWRQDDVFRFLNAANPAGYPPEATLQDVPRILHARGPGTVQLSASPLMHATGGWSACGALSSGGTSVLLGGRHFDAIELLDTIDREHVNSMIMVGDAFARPMGDALQAHPGRWRLDSLRLLASTGAALGAKTRQALLAHIPPSTQFMEGVSSSEAVSMAGSKVNADEKEVGHFRPAEGVRIITAEGRDVVPGSGEIGQFAVSTFVPLGYYKDPEKTAQTIRVIQGRRYVVPGDFATVEADGTVRFLGRGNVSINSGGEKVYPQEVENLLLRHPAVREAALVGVPHERYGQSVTAIVAFNPGASATETDLIAFVRAALADYKAPRHVIELEQLFRHPNGKLDYPQLQAYAIQRLQPGLSP